MALCSSCRQSFIGDKRASLCADCAYTTPPAHAGEGVRRASTRIRQMYYSGPDPLVAEENIAGVIREEISLSPSASAPVEVTDEVIADLRTITQITPDFDGEDEDGERHELHQCLETAKRIARRALTAALKGKES